MKREEDDKHKIEGPVFMQGGEPGGNIDFPRQGEAGNEFEAYDNQKNRSAKSNKIVREHNLKL